MTSASAIDAGSKSDRLQSSSAARALFQWLAPYVTTAALAYPTLVWPLLEAETVELGLVVSQASVDQAPSALLRIYFSILLLLGIICLMTKEGSRWSWLRRAPILGALGFLAWAAMTTFWAVEPAISIRRFFLAVFILGSILGGAIATRDVDRLLRIIFGMFAVMVLINTVSVLTTPPTLLGHAGIYPHKNYFAAVTSVMILFAIYQVLNGTRVTRTIACLMILAGGWFLVVAQSKTCLALIGIVPPIAFASTQIARHLRISPALTIGALAAGVYWVYQFGVLSGFWDFPAMAQAIFGDPTLTQRTDIWNFAFKKIPDRLWTGYGYEVFWGAGLDSPSIREAPGFVAKMPHSHNGYIDLVLHTGLVGLGIFLLLLLAALHSAGRLAVRSGALATLILSLLVFDLLYNCLETTFFRSFGLNNMTFILALVLLSRPLPEPADSEAP